MFLLGAVVAIAVAAPGVAAVSVAEWERAAIQQPAATPPPNLYMWIPTTNAPGPPLYPNPLVLWAETGPTILPTLPPLPEQCFGCHCLLALPGSFIAGGSIADKYTCVGGAATATIPEISWAGTANTALNADGGPSSIGKPCKDCVSYAITMDDLDYPNGNGEADNHVHSIFWALNIPGDWTELNMENAYQMGDEAPIVTMNKNRQGHQGMERLCPTKGTHRYKVTLYALDSYVGSALNPVDSNWGVGKVKAEISAREMAKHTFFANLKAPGWGQTRAANDHYRGGFLQRTTL